MHVEPHSPAVTPMLAEFIAFVGGEEYAVMSTIDATGAPSSALVGVAVAADGSLVIDSQRDARKVGNVQHDHRVAVVVGLGSPTSWQVEGDASVLAGTDRTAAERVYLARFPSARVTHVDFAVIRIRPRVLRRYTVGVGLTELALDRHLG